VELTAPLIGIVGGNGRMGSWFKHFFEQQGLGVLTAGPGDDPSPAELAQRCDVVVLSVPIAATLPVIRELAPQVRPEALLMDLTSIKAEPVRAMLAWGACQVVGAHPLFGPETRPADALRMVLCPGRGEDGLGWLQRVLRAGGIQPCLMPPEDHDRRMGMIQGLLHFTTLVLARCLAGSGFAAEELEACATPNFQQAVGRIRGLLAQPSDLFEGLLMENPHAGPCMDTYIRAAEQLREEIRKLDRVAFNRQFDMLRGCFDPQAKQGESG